jgi:hypothetical protein
MEKIIKIIGFLAFVLLLITGTMIVFSILWNAQNESLLHNLVRISGSITCSLGVTWAIMFAYNEVILNK